MIWAADRGAPSMMSHTQVGDLRSSLVDRRLAKNRKRCRSRHQLLDPFEMPGEPFSRTRSVNPGPVLSATPAS